MMRCEMLIRLICWNPDEARKRVGALEEAGFRVDASPIKSSVVAHFRANLPAVVVIDLDRLPSHGREVAIALRNSKSTRLIPIVFAGGVAEKVERIRRELPDAFYSEWKKVAPVIRKALKHAPSDPVQPPAHMQRYAQSPLVKKLGFRPGMKVALLAEPDGFEEKLGELPEAVELQTKTTRATELALWFVRSRSELDTETEYLGARLPEGCSLWIVHPKQTSRYRVDFNQNDVRAAGLAAGWVDYKVCAIDDDWSGLKFARKKTIKK